MNSFWHISRHSILVLIGLLILSCPPALAQKPAVNAQPVATQLATPWDLEYWGSDSLLFTQKGGQVIRLDIKNAVYDTLFVVDNLAELQHSGLMGMALHPAWPDTLSAYVVYAFYNAQFQVLLRLQRLDYDAQNDRFLPGKILLDDIPGAATTTGARVICTRDHLFLSTGDINLGTVSQDTASLNGKVLRLNLDGSIPQDNPFEGSPVWTLGHRNPQGLAMSPEGNLFACEHGASANDELNLLLKGRNYGWPEVSGFCDGAPSCQELNLVEPLRTWSPPIAPCGLAYVDTTQVLMNGLLMAGLRGTALFWVRLNNEQDEVLGVDTLLPSVFGRIRDVLVTKDNRIFVATSNAERPNPISPDDDRILELFTGYLSNEKEAVAHFPIRLFVSNRTLNLTHENLFERKGNWRLYRLDAALAMQGDIPAGRSHLSADLGNLPAGYYFISIQSPEGQYYQKIYLAPR